MAVNTLPTFGTWVYCTTVDGSVGIPFVWCSHSSLLFAFASFDSRLRDVIGAAGLLKMNARTLGRKRRHTAVAITAAVVTPKASELLFLMVLEEYRTFFFTLLLRFRDPKSSYRHKYYYSHVQLSYNHLTKGIFYQISR